MSIEPIGKASGVVGILDDFKISAIMLALLFAALVGFGWYMYAQGKDACQTDVRTATSLAEDKNDRANRAALVAEQADEIARLREELETQILLDSDDDPENDSVAAPVWQCALAGLCDDRPQP